jgi:hypothetical protein
MALYVFKCPACGGQDEILCPVAQRDDPVECACGAVMERVPFPGGGVLIDTPLAYLPSESWLPD